MLKNHSSKDMRANPLFMRNTFPGVGEWGIPLVRKQSIDLSNVRMIACSETRPHDSVERCACGVHFFVDDYRFRGIYRNPGKSFGKYSQYAFLTTPDESVYAYHPEPALNHGV